MISEENLYWWTYLSQMKLELLLLSGVKNQGLQSTEGSDSNFLLQNFNNLLFIKLGIVNIPIENIKENYQKMFYFFHFPNVKFL